MAGSSPAMTCEGGYSGKNAQASSPSLFRGILVVQEVDDLLVVGAEQIVGDEHRRLSRRTIVELLDHRIAGLEDRVDRLRRLDLIGGQRLAGDVGKGGEGESNGGENSGQQISAHHYHLQNTLAPS